MQVLNYFRFEVPQPTVQQQFFIFLLVQNDLVFVVFVADEIPLVDRFPCAGQVLASVLEKVADIRIDSAMLILEDFL